jgi:hypothetical protein
MTRKKNDKVRKQQKAWAREAAKREACIVKSAANPTKVSHTSAASEELVRQFDSALAGLGEPKDRYFASIDAMTNRSQGTFRGMDDYKAELGDLTHEWLWKMRYAEEPVVIRSNHGTAVGFSFVIKTEDGRSFSTDFGLYVESDGSIDCPPEGIAACMSWHHRFMAAYELEDRVRRAHASMAMRLIDAYGLRLTA